MVFLLLRWIAKSNGLQRNFAWFGLDCQIQASNRQFRPSTGNRAAMQSFFLLPDEPLALADDGI